MIQIKSLFSGWHEATHEEALEFAKWKAKALYQGRDKEQILADRINSEIRGAQFTRGELYGSNS
jgi:hypothetical protein